MDWSKDAPEQAGYYWMKAASGADQRPALCMVIQYPNELRVMFIGDPQMYQLVEKDNMWAGPLLPPTK